MVQKSQTTTVWMSKNPVNNGGCSLSTSTGENRRRVRTLDIVGGFWSAETRQHLDRKWWPFFCFE